MNDLERALLELDVDWPATPDLAAAVSARIATEPNLKVPGTFRFGRRRVAAIAGAVVLVLAGGTLAVPEARSTVFRWLGIESVEIKREEPRPVPGASLGLGSRTTVDALRQDGVPVLVPEELGDPPAVYRSTMPATTAASLVYDGPVLVQTFRATAQPFIQKSLGMGANLERLDVGSDTAFWITGAHGFAYELPSGEANFEEQRIAGNTLLVDRSDGLLLRVEGANLTRDEAVAIAASVQ